MRFHSPSLIFLYSIWLLLCACSFADARTNIIVSYTEADQPPILFNKSSAGLCVDIITALNEVQEEYHFEFTPYPGQRLLEFVDDPTKFDLLIYYNPIWVGESSEYFETSLLLTQTKEIMISLKKNGRTQQFFEKIGEIPSVGVRGYHYAFADYTTNETTLNQVYQMTLVNDELTVIEMILFNRGDIGIVKDSSLAYYNMLHPENTKNIMTSDKPHSQFDTMFLVRKVSSITTNQLNGYLKTLSQQGKLNKIYRKYGLLPPSYD